MTQDDTAPRRRVLLDDYRRDPVRIIEDSDAKAIDVVMDNGEVYMTLGPLWSAMSDE